MVLNISLDYLVIFFFSSCKPFTTTWDTNIYIVQMPNLIAHTNMDSDAVHVLNDYLSDLLRFMQKQQKHLFQTEYENAPPGYLALSGAN